MRTRWVGLAFVVLASASIAIPAAAQQTERDILNTLHFRSGIIELGDHLAEIAQTDRFHYLGNADTQTFLTKIWNNPPGAGKSSLGMILPTDVNPLAAELWAVVVSYDASGYVSDQDAEKIDYDELMKEMQGATADASKKRVEEGQQSIELLGWARKPYYDASTKKLFWAKRLRFGGSQHETLNYQIRILGRRGVLDLNVVASMDALSSIDQRAQTILSMVHFNQGNTYAEYDSNIDKSAAYGLAGLIAGGVLVKVGFFKGLVALVIAFKKVILIAAFGGFAAVWAGVKRFFARKERLAAAKNEDLASPIAVASADHPPADIRPPA